MTTFRLFFSYRLLVIFCTHRGAAMCIKVSRSQQLPFSLTTALYQTTGETLVPPTPPLWAAPCAVAQPLSAVVFAAAACSRLPSPPFLGLPSSCLRAFGVGVEDEPLLPEGPTVGWYLLVSVCGVGCSVCVPCYMSCRRVLFCVMYCRAPLSWCHMDYVCPIYFHKFVSARTTDGPSPGAS